MTKNLNWNRLAKQTGYSTIEITLEDGTPDGTMQWNYQRGDSCDCWIVTRHDKENNQVGEGNYMAVNRLELPAILKEMGTQTILDLDQYHHNVTRWGTKNSDHVVSVRDGRDYGSGIWQWSSTDGDRWYSSAYDTARDTAALALGCVSGIGTRRDEVFQVD